jgi:hypothetical protein
MILLCDILYQIVLILGTGIVGGVAAAFLVNAIVSSIRR